MSTQKNQKNQTEVTCNSFDKQRQITDILTVNVNKTALSDKVSYNN